MRENLYCSDLIIGTTRYIILWIRLNSIFAPRYVPLLDVTYDWELIETIFERKVLNTQ